MTQDGNNSFDVDLCRCRINIGRPHGEHIRNKNLTFVNFGCAYSFSAFFAPLQASFGASRGALSWVLSIAISLFFIIGAASGPIADRIGARVMALAGSLIVGLGLYVAAEAQALWQVYLGFGLGIGVGSQARGNVGQGGVTALAAA